MAPNVFTPALSRAQTSAPLHFLFAFYSFGLRVLSSSCICWLVLLYFQVEFLVCTKAII